MTPEQKAAYINAQAVAALARLLGMQAENKACEIENCTPVYGEADFADVANEYGVHHNAVMTVFQDW